MQARLVAIDAAGGQAIVHRDDGWFRLAADDGWQPIPLRSEHDAIRCVASGLYIEIDRLFQSQDELVEHIRREFRSAVSYDDVPLQSIIALRTVADAPTAARKAPLEAAAGQPARRARPPSAAPATSTELLELAELQVLGVLDDDDDQRLELALRSATDIMRAEIRARQEAVARDISELMSDIVPSPALKQRVLTAVREAIAIESGTVEPIRTLPRRKRQVSPWWRAAAITMMAATFALSFFIVQAARQMSELKGELGGRLSFKANAPDTAALAAFTAQGERYVLLVTNLDPRAEYTLVAIDPDGVEDPLTLTIAPGATEVLLPPAFAQRLKSHRFELRAPGGQVLLST